VQSILCRNIAHSTSDADLRQLFERFGALRDVYTPKDFHTKRPKGFAFIEYVDERDAEDARAQVDGSMLDGRCVHGERGALPRSAARPCRARAHPLRQAYGGALTRDPAAQGVQPPVPAAQQRPVFDRPRHAHLSFDRPRPSRAGAWR